MSEQAKFCPFCGATGDLIEITPWHGGGPDKHMVSCINDDCEVQPQVTGETKASAVAAWNKRAESEQVSALQASHADLKAALQGLIGWVPNEAAMARMGFHTDAPVNAHKKAQAALAAAKDLT